MHRKIIIGTLAVFVVLIAAGGLLRLRKKETERIYPSLATLIPPDSTIVAGIQLERIKRTPTWERLVADKQFAFLDQFKKKTGIDPREDVYEIITVSNGTSAPAYLVAGRFTKGGSGAAGMEPPIVLDDERVVRTAYHGFSLIGNANTSVCFLNTATAIAGPTPAVKAILDRQAANPVPPQQIIDRIRAIPIENQIWAYSTAKVDRLLPSMNMGGFKLGSLPLRINYLELTADLSLGVRINMRAHNDDKESADKMLGALKGLLGLARLSTPDDRKQLHQFYDSVQVTQDDTVVKLSGNATTDLLVKLLNEFSNRG